MWGDAWAGGRMAVVRLAELARGN